MAPLKHLKPHLIPQTKFSIKGRRFAIWSSGPIEEPIVSFQVFDIKGGLTVITHPACADRALAAAGRARTSRMAVRALRPFRRPVSTIEQRAA